MGRLEKDFPLIKFEIVSSSIQSRRLEFGNDSSSDVTGPLIDDGRSRHGGRHSGTTASPPIQQPNE